MIFTGALKKLIYCIITVGSISILSYLERPSSEIFSEILLLEQQHKLFIQEIEQWLQVMADAYIAALNEIERKKQALEEIQRTKSSWKHWINIIPQIVDQTADLRHQTVDYLNQTADFISNNKKIIALSLIGCVLIYCGYSIYNMPDNFLYTVTYIGNSTIDGLRLATAIIESRFDDIPTEYVFLIPSYIPSHLIDLEFWDVHFFLEGYGELYFYEITDTLFNSLSDDAQNEVLTQWYQFFTLE